MVGILEWSTMIETNLAPHPGWDYEPKILVGSLDYTLIWAKAVHVSRYVTPTGTIYFGAIARPDGELRTCFATLNAAAILHWLEDMA
jgi:hypothetical protein